MKKKTYKNNGSNWPTSNKALVNNYLQFFATFVNLLILQICSEALL